MNLTKDHALTLDSADPLAAFRERFVVEDEALIYLDGNSLGRLPRATQSRMRELVDHQWGERLIRGWNEGWLDAPARIGDKIGQLIGARPRSVLIADSTSVNLYKLLLAAVIAQEGRRTIVTDDLNFPSDLYIMQGVAKLTGAEIVVVESDGIHGPVEAIAEALDENSAVLCLSHTAFKSGYTYDLSAVTALAHDVGAVALWDLSHSVGAVEIDLTAAKVDSAVGCTYKYLNGGPGAPAFLYLREDLQEQWQNPVSGWMGQADLFGFGLTYDAAPGLTRFQTGTPPILSLSAIEPGVDLLLEAGMAAVRAKSVALSDYLIGLWEAKLKPLGFRLNSPRDVARRGSHVSLGHEHGLAIDLALIEEMGVLPDFRKPDSIRLGLTPLTTSFADVWEAVERMRLVVSQRRYEAYRTQSVVVT